MIRPGHPLTGARLCILAALLAALLTVGFCGLVAFLGF